MLTDEVHFKTLGLCFYLPCLDEVTVVDMRTLSFAVPPQEVLPPHAIHAEYTLIEPVRAGRNARRVYSH